MLMGRQIGRFSLRFRSGVLIHGSHLMVMLRTSFFPVGGDELGHSRWVTGLTPVFELNCGGFSGVIAVTRHYRADS